MKACKTHTGKIVHAAREVPNFVGNGGRRFTALLPVCGASGAGSRSLTFGMLATNRPITCESCLQAIAKAWGY